MKRFICWSGGKDSTASIILSHKMGLQIDGVVMSEVMFDHSRNISGENPKHIEWVHNHAIPLICKQFGYKVFVLRDKSDYLQEFYHVVEKSKIPERNGKFSGFFIAGKCVGNDRLKVRPLNKFFNSFCDTEIEKIVGIAYDEPIRLKRLINTNKRSLLAEVRITEEMTYDICRHYSLLSPIYTNNTRNGCWFCPNSRIDELAQLKKDFPFYWAELKKLSVDTNTISKCFKYSLTFDEIEKKVDYLNNQITIWSLYNV